MRPNLSEALLSPKGSAIGLGLLCTMCVAIYLPRTSVSALVSTDPIHPLPVLIACSICAMMLRMSIVLCPFERLAEPPAWRKAVGIAFGVIGSVGTGFTLPVAMLAIVSAIRMILPQ